MQVGLAIVYVSVEDDHFAQRFGVAFELPWRSPFPIALALKCHHLFRNPVLAQHSKVVEECDGGVWGCGRAIEQVNGGEAEVVRLHCGGALQGTKKAVCQQTSALATAQ